MIRNRSDPSVERTGRQGAPEPRRAGSWREAGSVAPEVTHFEMAAAGAGEEQGGGVALKRGRAAARRAGGIWGPREGEGRVRGPSVLLPGSAGAPRFRGVLRSPVFGPPDPPRSPELCGPALGSGGS